VAMPPPDGVVIVDFLPSLPVAVVEGEPCDEEDEDDEEDEEEDDDAAAAPNLAPFLALDAVDGAVALEDAGGAERAVNWPSGAM